ncbi:MAG TPA: universal stress protein [Parasegetibacter sp.]|jgi:nucleotide-binding universal stress UspA family protein
MFTILVPIDFSSASRSAADYAGQLAKELGANLLLFHAYMLPTPVSEVPYVLVTADQLQKENEDLLKRESDRLFNEYGVQVEWLVRIGIPSTEIKVLTEERAISLIVMGMKGQNGLGKIIGSTTTNTLQKVQTPLLIVPENCGYTKPLNITYATDFNYETPKETYLPLKEIAEKFDATVRVLHVTKEGEILSADAISGKVGRGVFFENLRVEFHELSDNSIQAGITRFVENHPTDILVMVAHTHNFLERLFTKSQTKHMAFETRVPLLALKA